MKEYTYIAIDLKSFYASVECMQRGLNPLTTNLVVADASRTEKTICLAVSPSLKAYGIPGRARLFEVVEKVKEANILRAQSGKPPIDYIVATPQMSKYMEISSKIYQIYLKYVAPEDMHVYSIDEVFIDATSYLRAAGVSARDFAMQMIQDVLRETGITATAGIASNLFLCKVAMDVEAKHIPADKDGVRIAELTEREYREKYWNHEPLTDFWRVGKGIEKRLYKYGIRTMGDICRMSLQHEDLLYREFGVNAELLIDHAWGYEPCTMKEIKAYKAESNSISSGQVLTEPYTPEKAKLVVKEMADVLALDLVAKGMVTDQVTLTVGYDIENMQDPERLRNYHGEFKKDFYGRLVPKMAHGSENLGKYTSSTEKIIAAMMRLYDRIVHPELLVRRMYVVANHILPKEEVAKKKEPEQMSLFSFGLGESIEKERLEKEESLQKAMLDIKKKYGKNAILKGMNFEEGATTRTRNEQVGGHKA